jgi:predicted P-loop ATPase
MAKKLKIEHTGEDLPKTNNAVLDIMFFLSRNYKLRLNSISRNIELNDDPIDDSIVNSIYVNIKKNYPKSSKELVKSILFSDFIEIYNPFTELANYYKENEPVVKTGYIDKLIATIKTDTPHADIWIKKWYVSMIASMHYQHSPLLLVLCGGQNTGKTEWFRRLLPSKFKKYYAESKLDAGKDDEILMTKKIIIMDDEMGGKSKAEQKKLKSITSKQTFSVRKPYGSVPEDLIRIAMLCGTTNEEEVLNDPTGNRRILPILVKGIKHTEYNEINKDLLFYEAWCLYEQGYDYQLSKEDIKLLNESTSNFKQSNPEEELIAKYFGVPGEATGELVYLTNSEILSYIKIHSQTTLSGNKLGMILKEMGLIQNHVKFGKTTIRKYSIIKLNLSIETSPYAPTAGTEQRDDKF